MSKVVPRPVQDPTAVQVKPSATDGLGLFAARAFAPGQTIRRINVLREITAERPLRPELGERFDHCDYPDGKVVLLGFPDRHVNHCCEPNAFVRYAGGQCFFVALRPIAPGAEITIDYNVNLTGGTEWPCHCGASRCSGRCVGDFFRLPAAIQREYRPLLAPWFVRAHAQRLEALTEGAK